MKKLYILTLFWSVFFSLPFNCREKHTNQPCTHIKTIDRWSWSSHYNALSSWQSCGCLPNTLYLVKHQGELQIASASLLQQHKVCIPHHKSWPKSAQAAEQQQSPRRWLKSPKIPNWSCICRMRAEQTWLTEAPPGNPKAWCQTPQNTQRWSVYLPFQLIILPPSFPDGWLLSQSIFFFMQINRFIRVYSNYTHHCYKKKN